MASCREQPPVPIPPIFCVVVVTKILAPAEIVATLVAFSPGTAKLASARKTAAEPRMKATKMRGLKMPDSEVGVFFINSWLFTSVLSQIRPEVMRKMRNPLQKITKRTKIRFCPSSKPFKPKEQTKPRFLLEL